MEKPGNIHPIGHYLANRKLFKITEILVVFISAILIIRTGSLFTDENPVLNQTIVWLANIVMLLLIRGGLRLRGQSWKHLGLYRKNINLRTFSSSFVVFVAAMAAFVIGSIIMANITGIPESADMSKYNYLQGNLLLLAVVLIAVFIASSFGEEVIYRGFLINRISELGQNGKKWLNIAVIISSVIFGLVHYDWGPMGMVQTGLMGLSLGISYLILKRNLWVLVMAHAYMDTILMIQMYLG